VSDRRLAAVLFSDIKGYSSQMERDEAAALARLDIHNALFREQIAAHNGREIKTVGDAFMVEFRVPWRRSRAHSMCCEPWMATTRAPTMSPFSCGWEHM